MRLPLGNAFAVGAMRLPLDHAFAVGLAFAIGFSQKSSRVVWEVERCFCKHYSRRSAIQAGTAPTYPSQT